ncbi:hypothetical protein FM107_05875 [Sphingobacterium sp. JB170]|nr:hypothetical protein FM107_05875 [Sphingobacterium sp. JB170]
MASGEISKLFLLAASVLSEYQLSYLMNKIVNEFEHSENRTAI